MKRADLGNLLGVQDAAPVATGPTATPFGGLVTAPGPRPGPERRRQLHRPRAAEAPGVDAERRRGPARSGSGGPAMTLGVLVASLVQGALLATVVTLVAFVVSDRRGGAR